MQRIAGKTWGRPIASAVLSLALVAGAAPTAALAEEKVAEPSEQVKKTFDELSELNETAEQSTYDVISLTAKLDETNKHIAELDFQIAQSTEDLEKARASLATIVADSYKQGNVSLLDMIIDSVSFDDFVSRLFYANKVVEYQKSAIEQVDDLTASLTNQKVDLEQSKANLERMIAEQTTRVETAQQAVQEVQRFLEQIPPEVLQEVVAYDQALRTADAEQSREALERLQASASTSNPDTASMVATALAQVTASATSQNSDATQASSSSTAAADTAAAAAAISAATTSNSSAGDSSSSSSSSSYSDMLARAYSLLGAGYQWSGYNWTGDTASSSFTCSGVVDYALGRSSQSSSPESLYAEVGSNLTTDVNSLQEGDLVFYSYGGRDVGHVGIYVGDGQVLDSIPNGGVALRDVDYMDVVGGGSLS